MSRRRSLGLASILFTTAVVATGCIADEDSANPSSSEVSTEADRSQVVPVANVVAVSQLASGDVVVGDRKTGDIWRFAVDDLQPSLVTTINVGGEGQRGLLGLVAIGTSEDEVLYVSWTTPDLDLVVGSLDLADLRGDSGGDQMQPSIVWSGFESASGANGGHLGALPDGRLVLGVGTLQDSSAIADANTVNGKLLALQPDGGPNQQPEVLSDSWKNPFAFDVTANGEIWVADNEPEDGTAERIGRGDAASTEAPIDIQSALAPGALVVLDSERLGLCSYLTGEMLEVDVSTGTASQPGAVLTADCRTASLVLADGRLLVSDEQVVRLQDFDDN